MRVRNSVDKARIGKKKTISDGALVKSPTGIRGFDEMTGGGLPRGRPTLVCGGPGCGKTLFALEFLVRGATEYGEPGVFVSFEERPEDLAVNVASLGFDLAALVKEKKLLVDHVHVQRSEIEETGDYDLDGLFIRIGHAIDTVGARRIVLDTIESLFSGLSNEGILRAELRRLFGWLKDKGVTAVITGERGDRALTRQGLEEYVSDCVILLDNRVVNDISTRRLRIVKYRGSKHTTNECPFLIDDGGFSITPMSSVGLTNEASEERVTTGIDRLDRMLGGSGYFRGSSVLTSGGAGTGKSTLAATFAASTCRRGERCVYFAFEESESQILRNVRSIGIDLAPCVAHGLLRFRNSRPTFCGLEMHLAAMHKMVEEFEPSAVIVDPVTNILQVGDAREAATMLIRLLDFLKLRGITSMFTSLTAGGSAVEATEVGVSSMMDTWILLRNLEADGERNRGLYVLKSRGMAHSNQVREFVMTNQGIQLIDVYTGSGGVLMGSARVNQEAFEAAEETRRRAAIDERERVMRRKHAALEGQIAAIRAEIDEDRSSLELDRNVELSRRDRGDALRGELARRKNADSATQNPQPRSRKKNGQELRG
ncbi:MAG TPA: circadian clock protein KaiC [Polyangiaceae bacterium]|nr:circadian clock protein KaiC [Polyangiaceae bacterium]